MFYVSDKHQMGDTYYFSFIFLHKAIDPIVFTLIYNLHYINLFDIYWGP